MKRAVCILFFITVILSGCSERMEQVVSHYYLLTIDTDLHLSYKIDEDGSIGLVSDVVAVAHTDYFIFIKQKESEHFDPHEMANNYYIVPIYDTLTWTPEKGIIGPLTENDFKSKCQELHLPQKIDFKEVE